ncbi:MAG: cell wall metabolism sensor histidine kinase WalK, partial [Gammaproteobacteria bacterium]|nr:cell wall metabolism sensor histidine kinase WalK [Gammaproteobacteria bacterium]
MKPALGIRAKLFLVSLLIILWVGFTAGIFLEYQLRTWAESRIESELFRHARAAREWMGREELVSIDVIDPIADRLGQATSVRITVIHQDGRVVGDSKLNRLEVEQVEKHAGRPEVMEAIEAGRGLSRRYSTTLGAHMLYVAVPFGGNQGGGVVRTAMPLTEVDHAVGELRLLLVVAGVLGTVFAILMSGMASHMFTRPLRSLLKHVRGVSGSSKGKGKAAGTRDEIEGLAGSFNQLTSELEEQVNALARERDRSTAIFEGMSESLFALNSERKVTLVNRAALELLGVTEAPIGRELPEMLGVPALDGLVTGVMEGKGGPLEFDYTCGTPRRILAHATPQRFSGGGVVVMHDITEVRKMEILRREFIANASHELRTPVSVIRANTETLLDGALDDRKVAHDLIEAMDRNAGRLTRIISDLMELARLDAGRYELSVTEVELKEAVYMAMETLRGKARIRDITLESRIDP